MSEASVFRLFAKEAMRDARNAISEDGIEPPPSDKAYPPLIAPVDLRQSGLCRLA